jgi:acetyl esterase/lipase
MTSRLVAVTAGLLCCAAVAAAPQPPKGKQPAKDKAQPKLPEGTNVLRDVAYVPGGHPRQTLDLYVPAGRKPLPLVIWVHGGAWLGGDKSGGPWPVLLSHGYAVACVNYRLSGHAPFPAQIADCKAAVRWLRANAGKPVLDPDRFGAWGSSAGGHLVALLGTAGGVTEWETVGEHRDVSSRVQAVCDWFGPADLARMGKQSRPNSRLDHDAPDSPESRLLGGPIRENRAKADTASPIAYVSKDAPPFLVMHGDKDDTVPHAQSVAFAAALKKAGVPVTFHTVAGAGHGFGGPDIQRMVLEFFDKHLKK